MPLPSQVLEGWSQWCPLEGCWQGAAIPSEPGLYRIRRVGEEDLDYLGQTGMTLRRRLSMLSGAYRTEMPYRDPHTAAPSLWALRHAKSCAFEASVVPVQGDVRWRKGLEALALALYRQKYGRSPTANFGRMVRGYQLSSGNNARLVTTGKRYRGGPTSAEQDSWLEGIRPLGPLEGSPQGARWCGHEWSVWANLSKGSDLPLDTRGLYRVRDPALPGLVYVGEGYVTSRLASHLAKGAKATHRQASFFTARLECSWTSNAAWLRHQRLELETDLIGAHMLSVGEAPSAQFLG